MTLRASSTVVAVLFGAPSDPGAGGGVQTPLGTGLDPRSPAFHEAARVCGGPHSIISFVARESAHG